MKLRTMTFAIVLGLAGCSASRPVLYPNPTYQAAGAVASKRDIDDCEALAQDAGASRSQGKPAEMAGNTLLGGGIGAASGAVGGAVIGAAASGSAVGAASGATASLLYSLIGLGQSKPSEPYVSIVDQCLRERGYQVAGWE
jgi:hypothetical protein